MQEIALKKDPPMKIQLYCLPCEQSLVIEEINNRAYDMRNRIKLI